MNRKHYLLSVEEGGVRQYAQRNPSCIQGYRLVLEREKAETFGETVKRIWLRQYPSGQAELVSEAIRPDLAPAREARQAAKRDARELAKRAREEKRTEARRAAEKKRDERLAKESEARRAREARKNEKAERIEAKRRAAREAREARQAKEAEKREKEVVRRRGEARESLAKKKALHLKPGGEFDRSNWVRARPAEPRVRELLDRFSRQVPLAGQKPLVVSTKRPIEFKVTNIGPEGRETVERQSAGWSEADEARRLERNAEIERQRQEEQERHDRATKVELLDYLGRRYSIGLHPGDSFIGWRIYTSKTGHVGDYKASGSFINKQEANAGAKKAIERMLAFDRATKKEVFVPEPEPSRALGEQKSPISLPTESPFLIIVGDASVPPGYEPVTPERVPTNKTREGLRAWLKERTGRIPALRPGTSLEQYANFVAQAADAAHNAQMRGLEATVYFRPVSTAEIEAYQKKEEDKRLEQVREVYEALDEVQKAKMVKELETRSMADILSYTKAGPSKKLDGEGALLLEEWIKDWGKIDPNFVKSMNEPLEDKARSVLGAQWNAMKKEGWTVERASGLMRPTESDALGPLPLAKVQQLLSRAITLKKPEGLPPKLSEFQSRLEDLGVGGIVVRLEDNRRGSKQNSALYLRKKRSGVPLAEQFERLYNPSGQVPLTGVFFFAPSTGLQFSGTMLRDLGEQYAKTPERFQFIYSRDPRFEAYQAGSGRPEGKVAQAIRDELRRTAPREHGFGASAAMQAETLAKKGEVTSEGLVRQANEEVERKYREQEARAFKSALSKNERYSLEVTAWRNVPAEKRSKARSTFNKLMPPQPEGRMMIEHNGKMTDIQEISDRDLLELSTSPLKASWLERVNAAETGDVSMSELREILKREVARKKKAEKSAAAPPRRSPAQDKKLREEFRKLRANHQKADDAFREAASILRVKYGSDRYGSKGEQKKLDALRERMSKTSNAFFAWLRKHSPRSWESGIAQHWVLSQLLYDDAVRPLSEPLSEVPVGSLGTTPQQAREFAAPHKERLSMRDEDLRRMPFEKFWEEYYSPGKLGRTDTPEHAEFLRRVREFLAIPSATERRKREDDYNPAFVTMAYDYGTREKLAKAKVPEGIFRVELPPSKGHSNPASFQFIWDASAKGFRDLLWVSPSWKRGEVNNLDAYRLAFEAPPRKLFIVLPGTEDHDHYTSPVTSNEEPVLAVLAQYFAPGGKYASKVKDGALHSWHLPHFRRLWEASHYQWLRRAPTAKVRSADSAVLSPEGEAALQKYLERKR